MDIELAAVDWYYHVYLHDFIFNIMQLLLWNVNNTNHSNLFVNELLTS